VFVPVPLYTSNLIIHSPFHRTYTQRSNGKPILSGFSGVEVSILNAICFEYHRGWVVEFEGKPTVQIKFVDEESLHSKHIHRFANFERKGVSVDNLCESISACLASTCTVAPYSNECQQWLLISPKYITMSETVELLANESVSRAFACYL